MWKEKTADKNFRQINLIRNTLLILAILLAIQFWLGMSINLELNLQFVHSSFMKTVMYYIQNYALVALHAGNAILILLASIMLVVVTFRFAMRDLKIVAVITMFSVIGALINGVLFLYYDQFFGYSIGMAMSAVSTFICVAAGFYFIGIEKGRHNVITKSQAGN